MIYLEDGFLDHEKMILAGDDGVMMWLRGLAWLKDRRSADGRIPKAIVIARLAPIVGGKALAPAPIMRRLIEVGSWHDEGEHVVVHGYVERNEASIQRSQIAKTKAEKRWANEREKRERAANGHAPADAAAMPEQMPQHASSTCNIPQSTSHSPKALTNSRSPPLVVAPEAGGWGKHEAKGPNETPDTRDRRRGLALRWQSVLRERGVEATHHACNEVVAKSLHVADWKVVDEQIGWFLEATVAPRSPIVLEHAVSRIAYR